MYIKMCSWQYSWKQKVLIFTLKTPGRGPKIIQGKENDAQVKSHDSMANSSETQEEPH